MNYTVIQNACHLNVAEIKKELENSKQNYILFQSFQDKLAQSQINAFIERFPNQLIENEIHFFQPNPKYLNWLKKTISKEKASNEKVDFINEIKLALPTYFEDTPHMVLPENYSYMLFSKRLIQEVSRLISDQEPVDKLVYEALKTSEHIVKQRILEKEIVKNYKIMEGDVIEKSITIYTKWLAIQTARSDIKLLNQKYQINMLNYLIRTYIGPKFKIKAEEINIEAAILILEKLNKFLKQQEKIIISSLVSLGYFFIQTPVIYYDIFFQNKAFIKAYFKFSKFLFANLHYNSRQYYLRYYPQSTNALYKAIRLNSKKPLKTCHRLYFANNR